MDSLTSMEYTVPHLGHLTSMIEQPSITIQSSFLPQQITTPISADASTIYYNNGVGPDPYPSPEINPITATDVAKHTYDKANTYHIVLTVHDDDGGACESAFSIVIG